MLMQWQRCYGDLGTGYKSSISKGIPKSLKTPQHKGVDSNTDYDAEEAEE